MGVKTRKALMEPELHEPPGLVRGSPLVGAVRQQFEKNQGMWPRPVDQWKSHPSPAKSSP